MAVVIALMAGIIAALVAGIVGVVLGIGIVIVLGWSGASFITVTGLALVIQQALGLL
ncbi:hypothetical protein ACIQPR_47620 [Streptomyces sp. NPDC091280]|uniref:hypothetical protein n=1 Tax=Streptomyces sp. NPDC091280 TaxID=3365984 RepID=UPI0037F910F8